MNTTTPNQIGQTMGKQAADSAIAQNLPRPWAGFDAQDNAQLSAAGLTPDTADWSAEELAARDTYFALVIRHFTGGDLQTISR